MADRFLPGVPGPQIEAIYRAAPGREITGKPPGCDRFDSPQSSAALAANTFGFFLNRAGELPPLPGCENEAWPATFLTLEKEVRLPKGIRWGPNHPHLDVLVAMSSALIGIESKRFEPFRKHRVAPPSKSYWKPVWGNRMNGYERVRDKLRENKGSYYSLDTAQLFKHAFGLRTQVAPGGEYEGLRPILFYVYAEPDFWPNNDKPVKETEKARHREEITAFAKEVKDDEVKFVSRSYRQLLEGWQGQGTAKTSRHAKAVLQRFTP